MSPDEAQALLQRAEALARAAHAAQTDKAGAPYVGHLERVAARLAPDTLAQAAGWLHDLVEDQPAHATELAAFPLPVVRAVYLLTREPGEDRETYLARIKVDPLARRVKLADIADNTDPARLAVLEPATQDRLLAKYTAARRTLLGA